MGIQLYLDHLLILFNMKACIVLFALAAVAFADSDPWYGYGHGLVLGSPCRNAWGVAVPCAGRKKREASAEAKPWLGLGYGAGIGYGYGLSLVSACHNAYGHPVPCAGRKKRSSEPWLGYAGLGHHGLILSPSDPTNPHAIHTSRLGVCLNNLGQRVPGLGC